MDTGVTFPGSLMGSPLCSLTLPLDLGGPLVPSPEADMMVTCGARSGQTMLHGGDPS